MLEAALYANTINVTNNGVLDVGNSTGNALQVDTLNLTSYTDAYNHVNAGVFDINSTDYVLNADLTNDRTNDKSQSNYGYGVIAMNSDGHLTINGNGDSDTSGDQSEVDNYGDHGSCGQPVTIKSVSTTRLAQVLLRITRVTSWSTLTTRTAPRPSLQPTKLTWVLTPIRHSSRVTPLFCSRWN